MAMQPMGTTRTDEPVSRQLVDAAPGKRHVSADLALGLGLLGVAIVGKLLWALSDGGLLAALGAR